MKMFMRFLAVALLLSGCASYNVLFPEQIVAWQERDLTDEDELDVLRLYVDGNGDLYPEKIRQLSSQMFAEQGKHTTTLYQVFEHFPCASPIAEHNEQTLCKARQSTTEAPRLAWREAQRVLWRQAAKEIHTRTDGNLQRPVIVLIHGFNVSSADQDYKKARDEVRAIFCQSSTVVKPIFVQVHWDGLSASMIPVTAWTRAQYNAPLVGIKLRQLFEYQDLIPHEQPIRIFTHSSGAIVAASLLGNAVAALPRAQEASTENCKSADMPSVNALPEADTTPEQAYEYQMYRCYARGDGKFPMPKHTDIRLGMIAPATAVESFQSTSMATQHGAGHQCVDGECGLQVQKLVMLLGINPLDYAVRKGINHCSLVGTSCLGTGGNAGDFSEYKRLRSELGNAKKTGITTHCIDFSHSTVGNNVKFGGDDHAWSTYLKRDQARPFLKWLLLAKKSEKLKECRTSESKMSVAL